MLHFRLGQLGEVSASQHSAASQWSNLDQGGLQEEVGNHGPRRNDRIRRTRKKFRTLPRRFRFVEKKARKGGMKAESGGRGSRQGKERGNAGKD